MASGLLGWHRLRGTLRFRPLDAPAPSLAVRALPAVELVLSWPVRPRRYFAARAYSGAASVPSAGSRWHAGPRLAARGASQARLQRRQPRRSGRRRGNARDQEKLGVRGASIQRRRAPSFTPAFTATMTSSRRQRCPIYPISLCYGAYGRRLGARRSCSCSCSRCATSSRSSSSVNPVEACICAIPGVLVLSPHANAPQTKDDRRRVPGLGGGKPRPL